MAHQAVSYPGFHSIKQLGILLLKINGNTGSLCTELWIECSRFKPCVMLLGKTHHSLALL